MTLEEAYKVLELPYGTTDTTLIQNKYKELTKKYHPDKWRTKGEKERNQAEKLLTLINEAKRVITSQKPTQQNIPRQSQQTPSPIRQTPQRVSIKQPRQPSQTTIKPNKNVQVNAYNNNSTYNTKPKEYYYNNRNHYNNAKSFQEDALRNIDKEEQYYHNEYAKYVKKRYWSPLWIFKYSLSMLSTLLVLIAHIYFLYYLLQTVPQEGNFIEIFMRLLTTRYSVTLLILLLAKFILFDTLGSNYINMLINKSTKKEIKGVSNILSSFLLFACLFAANILTGSDMLVIASNIMISIIPLIEFIYGVVLTIVSLANTKKQ